MPHDKLERMVRLLFSLSLLFGSCAAHAAEPALMPLPAKMEPASGKLAIDGNFRAAATGIQNPRLEAALNRFMARLSRQTGVPFLGAESPVLRVECAAAGPEYPTLGEDESYVLDVTPAGAQLKASTVTGALRGLATFLQLVTPGPEGFQAPAIHIEDTPRFQWRGLMLDASRHWMPVQLVERNLDAMEAVKLNVFHWHLSDDQGFRVESKRFPRLQAAGSDGNYYTQDEIRHIVAYARDRGIRVIPEFDIPGHTQSWFPGYPELSSEPGQYTIGRTWGVYDPVMDPTVESTYQFLDTFLGEMTQLFPDPYFHIGGDEVNGRAWNRSERIKAFAKDHNLDGPHGLQVYFNQRLLKILDRYGKIMVGWDEILHPDLPAAAVIQSWRGPKSLADAAAKGHRGILSSGYYLDHLSSASLHYSVDPLDGPAAQLTPEQMALILGGEACMWAEYVNAETVDSRIWPRMAAIAERFWSPREATDVDSMYTRMELVSRQLEWTGVQHRANLGPMLDRMAGGQSSQPLWVLADAVEGQGLGPRARTRKYTSLVPLNRLADAARPESENVRALELAARSWLKNPADAEDLTLLREQFGKWAANDSHFQPLAENNAILGELKPLSADLSALGVLGLKVLDYLGNKNPPPADWLASQNKEISRIQRPSAEVVLAAYRPVKLLLDELTRKSGR
jgi:hexosaminidase